MVLYSQGTPEQPQSYIRYADTSFDTYVFRFYILRRKSHRFMNICFEMVIKLFGLKQLMKEVLLIISQSNESFLPKKCQ